MAVARVVFKQLTQAAQHFRDHASVRLPGVLQTNEGHSNFRCVIFKKSSSDITAFEPGTLASLLVEHVGNVTVDF